MKHGKNPTAREKKTLHGNGLNPGEWLTVKRTPDILTVEHRVTGEIRHIRNREDKK